MTTSTEFSGFFKRSHSPALAMLSFGPCLRIMTMAWDGTMLMRSSKEHPLDRPKCLIRFRMGIVVAKQPPIGGYYQSGEREDGSKDSSGYPPAKGHVCQRKPGPEGPGFLVEGTGADQEIRLTPRGRGPFGLITGANPGPPQYSKGETAFGPSIMILDHFEIGLGMLADRADLGSAGPFVDVPAIAAPPANGFRP